jgi:hypothetical protein
VLVTEVKKLLMVWLNDQTVNIYASGPSSDFIWYFYGIKWLSKNETPVYNIALTGKMSQRT